MSDAHAPSKGHAHTRAEPCGQTTVPLLLAGALGALLFHAVPAQQPKHEAHNEHAPPVRDALQHDHDHDHGGPGDHDTRAEPHPEDAEPSLVQVVARKSPTNRARSSGVGNRHACAAMR